MVRGTPTEAAGLERTGQEPAIVAVEPVAGTAAGDKHPWRK